MSRRRWMIGTLAMVCGLGLVAGIAGAGPARFGWAAGPCPNRPLFKLVRESLAKFAELREDLNVSDQQRDQIKGIVKSHKSELAPVVKDLIAKRQALREAVLTGKTEADIRAAADELGKAIADTSVVASKVVGEVKGALTAEQIETLRQFRIEREEAVSDFVDQVFEEE